MTDLESTGATLATSTGAPDAVGHISRPFPGAGNTSPNGWSKPSKMGWFMTLFYPH
jgi:hypothetical protein